MDRRQQRNMVCVLAAGASLVAILLCLLGGAAVQYGRLAPPLLNLHIGNVRVVAFTAFASPCPKRPPAASPAAAIPSRGTYTILVLTPLPDRPSSRIGRTLLELPLRC